MNPHLYWTDLSSLYIEAKKPISPGSLRNGVGSFCSFRAQIKLAVRFGDLTVPG